MWKPAWRRSVHGSPAMERMVADGQVIVVGAEYDLGSGVVDFFDGVPRRSDS